MTKALRVWKLLCRNPWLPARAVAAEFGWESRATQKILQALGRDGCARATGSTWKRVWAATEIVPVDKRGMHPNSIANRSLGGLPEHRAKANEALRKLIAAGKLKTKNYRRVRLTPKESPLAGKIALEQFWTFPTKRIQPVVVVDNGNKPAHPRALALGTAENEEEAA